MLYFRSCPRCQTGTIQLDSDLYGSYLSCLNCGFEKSAASVRKLDFEEMRAEEEARQAAVVAAAADDSSEEDFDDDYYEDDEVIELERAAG